MKSLNLPVTGARTPSPETNTVYTCPMHPQIRLPKPGTCPICGMMLELVTPGATDESPSELKDMTRRFWVAAVLSLPLLWLTMGHMLPIPDLDAAIDRAAAKWTLPHLTSVSWSECVQAVLATPVVYGRDGRFSNGDGNPSLPGD